MFDNHAEATNPEPSNCTIDIHVKTTDHWPLQALAKVDPRLKNLLQFQWYACESLIQKCMMDDQ
eukprot:scaffold124235_cov22-Cyclotella_meneghiniana.AAC.3